MIVSPRQIEGTPKPTYPKGRLCRVCACELSIYNRYSRCWQHRSEGRELASLVRQSDRESFMAGWQDVMEGVE